MSKFQINFKVVLSLIICILVLGLILSLILYATSDKVKKSLLETFDGNSRMLWQQQNIALPTSTSGSSGSSLSPYDNSLLNEFQAELAGKSPDQLKQIISQLKQRLIDYGFMPDSNEFVKKSELMQNSGKCLVSTAEDRDLYIPKSQIPSPGPRIDLSQYVKKSSLPPEKVCPTVPEIDLSEYVKKSTLPPEQKCPQCICPKVKVSAGLCRECPPPPKCPPPEPCPIVTCPAPPPCPVVTCPQCSDVKYIKVPTVITKTIVVDQNNNILSSMTNNTTNTDPTTTNYTQSTQSTQPTILNSTVDNSVQSEYDNFYVTTPTLTQPVATVTTSFLNSPSFAVSNAEGCALGQNINTGNPLLNNDYSSSGGLPGL